MAQLHSLERSISPPLSRRKRATTYDEDSENHLNSTSRPGAPDPCFDHEDEGNGEPSLAAVEAGQAEVRDHLAYFSKHLKSRRRSFPRPILAIAAFQDLYLRNQNNKGHHFVVHQHDHPISGVHYDLRLQISSTSTVSWAIPYGLPGNANSRRPNRMAIETRIHNLWNNLIESASQETGSLLIWEIGEYEVLDRPQQKNRMTDDELSSDEPTEHALAPSQPERLYAAFKSRHIRLRLHGSRLPDGYTIAMKLPGNNNTGKGPNAPRARRGRPMRSSSNRLPPASVGDNSDAQSDTSSAVSTADGTTRAAEMDAAIASEAEDEVASIRANNAYPGATNSIGSVHQRHWLLTLDRANSGFHKARSELDEGRWIGPWQPFFVQGQEHERSVVTGRSADEVMHDEGVAGFAGRKMWRPILE